MDVQTLMTSSESRATGSYFSLNLSDVGLISSDFSDGFGFVFLGFTAEDMVTWFDKQCI